MSAYTQGALTSSPHPAFLVMSIAQQCDNGAKRSKKGMRQAKFKSKSRADAGQMQGEDSQHTIGYMGLIHVLATMNYRCYAPEAEPAVHVS